MMTMLNDEIFRNTNDDDMIFSDEEIFRNTNCNMAATTYPPPNSPLPTTKVLNSTVLQQQRSAP